MSHDTYLTLKQASEGIYKEKGSKFLAFAFPVVDEVEIKEKIKGLKKRFHDARHHCYAYVLGTDRTVFRANDDGEPHHSAGDPILGQIRSLKLTDTLIVVVRYFGGTKLGVGGLIHAYKSAAGEALNNNEIIEKKVMASFRLAFGYEHTDTIMRLIKELDLKIIHQELTDLWEMRVVVSLSNRERFLDRIDLLNKMGMEVKLEAFDQ